MREYYKQLKLISLVLKQMCEGNIRHASLNAAHYQAYIARHGTQVQKNGRVIDFVTF